jgi:hypothetical protein
MEMDLLTIAAFLRRRLLQAIDLLLIIFGAIYAFKLAQDGAA